MSLLGFDAPGRLALGQLSTIGPFNPSMRSDSGGYSVTGYDTGFTRDFEAWLPRRLNDAGNWTGKTVATTAWTDQALSPESWVARPTPPADWLPASQSPKSWTSE